MFPDVLLSCSISRIITAIARIRSIADSSKLSMLHRWLIWMYCVYRFDEFDVYIRV